MTYLHKLIEEQARERREARGGRRTAKRLEKFERRLRCVQCGTEEIVFEAAMGARTDAEHWWVEPATFLCDSCLPVVSVATYEAFLERLRETAT